MTDKELIFQTWAHITQQPDRQQPNPPPHFIYHWRGPACSVAMATCSSFPNNPKLQTWLLFLYSLVSPLSPPLLLISTGFQYRHSRSKWTQSSEHLKVKLIDYPSIVSCNPSPSWRPVVQVRPIEVAKCHVYPGQLTCDISMQKRSLAKTDLVSILSCIWKYFFFFFLGFSIFSWSFLSQNNSSTLLLYSVSSFLLERVSPLKHTHLNATHLCATCTSCRLTGEDKE